MTAHGHFQSRRVLFPGSMAGGPRGTASEKRERQVNRNNRAARVSGSLFKSGAGGKATWSPAGVALVAGGGSADRRSAVCSAFLAASKEGGMRGAVR